MYILLVGGPKSLDGTQKYVKDPNQRTPLQFYRPDSSRSMGKGVEFSAQTEIYRIEQVRGNNKSWWLAVHLSMNLDEALDTIFGRYP